jgi:hypothetical protein
MFTLRSAIVYSASNRIIYPGGKPGEGVCPCSRSCGVIPLPQLGTTDDCGFAPFLDDTSTARDLAFAKITARVHGTMLGAGRLMS